VERLMKSETGSSVSFASRAGQSPTWRISIPQDVLDRIAPTALPRSSLVISDEPLNRETNYRTEFVVVLNNQPQGGLAMRRRQNDLRVAGRSGWDDDSDKPIGTHVFTAVDFFGSFRWGNSDDQYASTRQRGGQRQWQW
jgi:hypothetical protein